MHRPSALGLLFVSLAAGLACSGTSGSEVLGQPAAGDSGVSNAEGDGGGAVTGDASTASGDAAVESAAGDGASPPHLADSGAKADSTWEDFAAGSDVWRVDRPFQSESTCAVLPPIGEFMRLTIAAGHGGPVAGDYVYCEPEGGNFRTNRCFDAMRMVGPTGASLARPGDQLVVDSYDPTSGRASGTVTTKRMGAIAFVAQICH